MHAIKGLVASSETLNSALAEGVIEGVAIPLQGGLAFFPVDYKASVNIQGVSRFGMAALIETEYFGGSGSQMAEVWDQGVLSKDFGWIDDPSGKGPISHALAMLGLKAHGYYDEFDAAGLGRYRSNNEWLNSGAE